MSGDEGGAERARTGPKPEAPAADAELLAALGQSRERAAALLVAQHGLAVGGFCMALLGRQSEAEDALQETLLAALGGPEQFHGQGTFRAWLLGIARLRCAKQLAERSRERDAKQAPGGAGMTATTPGAERIRMAQRARLLLEEIKPSEREALVLRFTGELSFREVAEIYSIDEDGARKRVSRGLSRLAVLLGEDQS